MDTDDDSKFFEDENLEEIKKKLKI